MGKKKKGGREIFDDERNVTRVCLLVHVCYRTCVSVTRECSREEPTLNKKIIVHH